jgi:hypothetical protein
MLPVVVVLSSPQSRFLCFSDFFLTVRKARSHNYLHRSVLKVGFVFINMRLVSSTVNYVEKMQINAN